MTSRIRRAAQRTALAAALAAAGAVGGSACASKGSNARQEQSDVSDELRQVTAHPDIEIVIRTGTEHWRTGEITLTVRGSGAAAVTQRRAGEVAAFEAALGKDEVEAFARLLADRHFTAPRTSKLPREPGDTPVRLALERGGRAAFEAQLWDADREDDADLDAILVAAQRLVHRVSRGALGAP